jgi:hypothetical protein
VNASEQRLRPGDTAPAEPGKRGYPRGPIGEVQSPTPVAIGYCPRCGENARATTAVRGLYQCPGCRYVWHDARVGKQQTRFEDFFAAPRGTHE